MESLSNIRNDILNNSLSQDRILKGIWSVDCLYNPSDNGRIFDYKFIVSQTKGQGCAYSIRSNYSHEILKNYVGKDFLEVDTNDVALEVSFLDSLYGVLFPPITKKRMTLDAPSIDKLKWRTQIIVDEAKRLLGNLRNKNIVNVGVVGDIIKSFNSAGANIIGTDYDQTIIGTNTFFGVPILNGDETLKAVKESDLAIITGMTITTNTIDKILDVCEKNNVRTIIFAETGSNFASYFTKRGVDIFLAEYFPFYIYNGYSVIDVCYQ